MVSAKQDARMHFHNGTLLVKRRQICFKRCYSPACGFGTPLRRYRFCESYILQPLKWSMTWQVTLLNFQVNVLNSAHGVQLERSTCLNCLCLRRLYGKARRNVLKWTTECLFLPAWWTWCRGCRGRWRSSGCSPHQADFDGKYPGSGRWGWREGWPQPAHQICTHQPQFSCIREEDILKTRSKAT